MVYFFTKRLKKKSVNRFNAEFLKATQSQKENSNLALNHQNFRVGTSSSGSQMPSMLMGATLRPIDTVQKLDGGPESDATPYGLMTL